MDKSKRPETVGFTLSAAVPLAAVGYVLKAMFDAGCPPNSFDLKAIVESAANGHAIEPARISGRKRKPTSAIKAEDLRQTILAVMSAHAGPMLRKDIFDAVRTHLGVRGFHARLNTAHTDLDKAGRIKKTGERGVYVLTGE